MTSSGEMVLPRDFDIFLPLSSSVKPCVMRVLKGALMPPTAASCHKPDEDEPGVVCGFLVAI
jgi:hypothetical protein